LPRRQRDVWLWASGTPSFDAFNGMIVLDELRLGFNLIFPARLVSHSLDLDRLGRGEQLPAGEFHSLLLFATVGMMLMASGNDLVIVFLGLEILSIATYVMAGFRRTDVSLERVVVEILHSRFVLSGVSALRHRAGLRRDIDCRTGGGVVPGTTNIGEIASRVNDAQYPALLFAGVADDASVGFGFKIRHRAFSHLDA
jgi:NADH-quinone oxidoreductase subunit N